MGSSLPHFCGRKRTEGPCSRLSIFDLSEGHPPSSKSHNCALPSSTSPLVEHTVSSSLENWVFHFSTPSPTLYSAEGIIYPTHPILHKNGLLSPTSLCIRMTSTSLPQYCCVSLWPKCSSTALYMNGPHLHPNNTCCSKEWPALPFSPTSFPHLCFHWAPLSPHPSSSSSSLGLGT